MRVDLIEKSIERLKNASEMSLYYYGKPLVCEYSGGKDSDVQLKLFELSGIPYEIHNSHTTVDAPGNRISHQKSLSRAGIERNKMYD